MESKTKKLGSVSTASRGKVGRKELRDLIESQGYRCALSGIKLTPDEAELDHKVPVSKGGTHGIENLQVLHVGINRMKGAIDNDEFIRLCKLVSQWTS